MSVLMSLASEFPEHTVSAEETKEFLRSYVGRDQVNGCLQQVDAAGIISRRSLGPLKQMMHAGGIEARNTHYASAALTLGMGAATAAMEHADIAPDQIESLIVSSSTGHMMPSLADHLAVRLRLRPTVQRVPLTGLGCSGSIRALSLAATRPDVGQRDRQTLVVSVELCSLWLQAEEPSPEDVVSALTFGDGAAAAVVDHSASDAQPELLASESILWPGSLTARGAMLTSTGFRHVASPALPISVLRNLRASVSAFLGRAGVTLRDLRFVAVNPRNERVLAAMADLLELPESLLAPARHVWQTRGNTLSVGSLYMLQVLQNTAPPSDGDLGMVLVLGPGVSCDLMLLRWHGRVSCGPLQA